MFDSVSLPRPRKARSAELRFSWSDSNMLLAPRFPKGRGRQKTQFLILMDIVRAWQDGRGLR